LTASRANTTDTFSAVTAEISAVALQPCPNGVSTLIAYTWTPSAAAGSGYQITLDLGALNATTKTVIISEVDLQLTPTFTTGLCAIPPAPIFRPLAIEMAFCLRYLYALWGFNCASYAAGGIGLVQTIQFPVPMRIKPAVTLVGTLTLSNCNAGSSNGQAITNTSAIIYYVTVASGGVQIQATAGAGFYYSAELI
jgi:hypothetical protein